MSSNWFVGVDVSKDTLEVRVLGDPLPKNVPNQVKNEDQGHRQLVSLLKKCPGIARVALEATGTYGLDLALALNEAAPKVEVMVANPRAIKNFAKALMKRGKSDPIDADVLAQYVMRMKFVQWKAPAPARLQLRAISRRIFALVHDSTIEKCRLHATMSSKALPEAIIQDIQANISAIEERISKLELAAEACIAQDEDLLKKYTMLLSTPGIGKKSAIRLLGELGLIPIDMDVRQLTAYAGLDPIPCSSGKTLNREMRISKAGNKFIRAALYMPAFVAIRFSPEIRDFFDHLIKKGKHRMTALTAVMRKMLHAIYGMFKTDTTFNPRTFRALAHPQEVVDTQ